MTNNILGVDTSINTNAFINSTSVDTSDEMFETVLKAKMNSATMSIADFENVNEDSSSTDLTSLYDSSSSSSLYDASTLSALLGNNGDIYGTSLLPNLTGSSNVNSDSEISSETMLAMIILSLAMGDSDSDASQIMFSSLSNALANKNGYTSSTYKGNSTSTFNGLSLTGSAYKTTHSIPGTGKYPSNMGQKCSPSIVNNVGNRSAKAYNNVIQQFNVETNSRYTPYKNGSTYCNIYVWDVTSAMGAEIPHRTDSNGDIADSKTSNVKYMTANAMYDWLGNKGKEYGWKEVSAEEAQKYANMGCPSVAAWKNPKGHGHIQMVVPSKDGSYNQSKGVAISQAGSKVIEYGYITDVYSSKRLNDIKYFVHA